MSTIKKTIMDRLIRLVDAMGHELTNELTVVGGTAPALHAGVEIPLRMTNDIDVVVRGGYHEWRRCLDKLEAQHFHASKEENAPICRYQKDDLILDVLLTEPDIGFTNKWYAEGVTQRQSTPIAGLYVVSPVYSRRAPGGRELLATKFEAYKSRGQRDPASSHDLEDTIVVLRRDRDLFALIVDGKAPVHEALRGYLKAFVADSFAADYVQALVEGDDA
jgi:hypothetical protein